MPSQDASGASADAESGTHGSLLPEPKAKRPSVSFDAGVRRSRSYVSNRKSRRDDRNRRPSTRAAPGAYESTRRSRLDDAAEATNPTMIPTHATPGSSYRGRSGGGGPIAPAPRSAAGDDDDGSSSTTTPRKDESSKTPAPQSTGDDGSNERQSDMDRNGPRRKLQRRNTSRGSNVKPSSLRSLDNSGHASLNGSDHVPSSLRSPNGSGYMETDPSLDEFWESIGSIPTPIRTPSMKESGSSLMELLQLTPTSTTMGETERDEEDEDIHDSDDEGRAAKRRGPSLPPLGDSFPFPASSIARTPDESPEITSEDSKSPEISPRGSGERNTVENEAPERQEPDESSEISSESSKSQHIFPEGSVESGSNESKTQGRPSMNILFGRKTGRSRSLSPLSVSRRSNASMTPKKKRSARSLSPHMRGVPRWTPSSTPSRSSKERRPSDLPPLSPASRPPQSMAKTTAAAASEIFRNGGPTPSGEAVDFLATGFGTSTSGEDSDLRSVESKPEKRVSLSAMRQRGSLEGFMADSSKESEEDDLRSVESPTVDLRSVESPVVDLSSVESPTVPMADDAEEKLPAPSDGVVPTPGNETESDDDEAGLQLFFDDRAADDEHMDALEKGAPVPMAPGEGNRETTARGEESPVSDSDSDVMWKTRDSEGGRIDKKVYILAGAFTIAVVIVIIIVSTV